MLNFYGEWRASIKRKTLLMDATAYAQIYKKFKRASSPRVIGNDVVALRFARVPFRAQWASRLYEFDRIVDAHPPLAVCLAEMFQVRCVSTLFLKRDSFTLLLDDRSVVFPSPSGECVLYATSLFVDDPQSIAADLQVGSKRVHEFAFFADDAIAFLDSHDLPLVGGDYFGNRAPSGGYRLCFLSRDEKPERFCENAVDRWRNHPRVRTAPFVVGELRQTPAFLTLRPFEGLDPPDPMARSDPIRKRASSRRPAFLIRDVLDSYAGTSFDDLGLIVPHSLRSYFVGLAVNCVRPKRTIVATEPYDRYVEYDHVPADVAEWTRVAYSRDDLEMPAPHVKHVSVDSVFVGIEFKKTFLCYGHPVLAPRPYRETNRVECLLAPMTRRTMETSPDLRVLATYSHGAQRLHRVGVDGVPYELWCRSDRAEGDDDPECTDVPDLVRTWLDFADRHQNSVRACRDSKLVKLALVLHTHRIRFRMRITDRCSNRLRWFEEQTIVLCMCSNAVRYVNDERLRRLDAANEERFSMRRRWA